MSNEESFSQIKENCIKISNQYSEDEIMLIAGVNELYAVIKKIIKQHIKYDKCWAFIENNSPINTQEMNGFLEDIKYTFFREHVIKLQANLSFIQQSNQSNCKKFESIAYKKILKVERIKNKPLPKIFLNELKRLM